ncbi:MAG: hypothetical protein JXA03_08845 [Bacteroidales bacterium]|nr:hypothetical protein [Bacteroidales bacterium]
MKQKFYLAIILILAFIIVKTLFFQDKNNQFQPVINHDTSGLVSLTGACPPYYLLTEYGDTINPHTGKNADQPYSPRQTCGKCHDYEKITQGFHFQQGKGEQPTPEQTRRVHWASGPGNYGGSWCSPAPLYSYLSAKKNNHEKLIDMTSYTFIEKCGVCHPGGGPLEYDRDNMRYDRVMADASFGFTEGGSNNLDGDYYKAKWISSGVIEADCYLCHLIGYNNKVRVQQIQAFNYRYAATAGSGFAKVSGSVSANQPVTVEYNKALFNPDGAVEPHVVKEPGNQVCLWCHAKPGYKKRGADFMARNDVHLRAGLKCVDCHPAGSMAVDERIRGKEIHQFGKGDDPGGLVRNDLDNTMRECVDCHETGWMGAPVARHAWLPPLHLDKIACQTCHIPERNVKSVHYVASDVFNPGTKIPTKGKYLWTFYGPDMNYWNHYGDLEMMGYDDKPTFTFSPELALYKGKIYPVDRVHTSWPAILTEGQEALMQPKMGDIYKMWIRHRADGANYPQLAQIMDHSGDGLYEVNSPEEIDALIAAISSFLKDIKYPMQGKKIAWVLNNRVYTSGTDFYEIPMEDYEASPFGNVHKYSHDIKPAKSALGVNGCTDCHAYNATFFFAQTLKTPFDESGKIVTGPQYKSLNVSGFSAYLGATRESIFKPLLNFTMVAFLLLVVVIIFLSSPAVRHVISSKQHQWIAWLTFFIILGAGLFIYLFPGLGRYMFPSRFFIDANHFLITAVVLITGIWFYLEYRLKSSRPKRLNLLAVFIIIAAISGFLMIVKLDWLNPVAGVVYTLFDLTMIGIIVSCVPFLFKTNEATDKPVGV